MIVTLAGPSGSGKTTLAKALAEHFDWEFRENSAGLIMDKHHKEYMKEHFKYEGGEGQRNVINRSHSDPAFGLYFQQSIVQARKMLLSNTVGRSVNAVYDRGPLDPIVFYLNQCVHNFDEATAESFFNSCIPGLRYVNLIIRVPLQNPALEIENNHARVANWWFQQKIDKLYDLSLSIVGHMAKVNPLIFEKQPISVFRTSTWDWKKRLEECIASIEKVKKENYY